VVGLGGVGLGVAECEATVVEALQEQDNVCERVVDGKDDLEWWVSMIRSDLRVNKRTIVGIMPCRTPPAILKKSPAVNNEVRHVRIRWAILQDKTPTYLAR
jgi:hypothetical protein